MGRLRLILVGAVLGLTWAAALRGYMMQLAGPKPYPDLSITTPHGAWAATLASSLFVALALACSIPMRLPDPIAVPATSETALTESPATSRSLP
jgi:hypothetical protein